MTNGWFTGSVRFPAAGPPEPEPVAAAVDQLRTGRATEAVALLEPAVQRHPARAELWALLGQAWVALDRTRNARACLERSLGLDPGNASLWSNLAVIHLRGGDPLRSLDACRRALELQPGLAAARQNAALALYMCGRDQEGDDLVQPVFERCLLRAHARRDGGDLEGAQEACREAIRCWEAGGGPAQRRIPPKFSLAGGRAALLAAKDRLDAAGIRFCLIAGTLLGIVRDGDLLAHDKDLDFGLDWEIDRGHAVAVLCAGGLFRVPETHFSLPEERPYSRGLQHAASGCALDLFFLEPDGDHFRCGLDGRPLPMLSRIQRFGFAEMQWGGTSFRVPDPAERYLAEIYGPGWREPDPHYDTILSNPARLPEAVPLAVCTAYLRVVEALTDGRIARARGIALQILRRQPDPFMQGLAERLAGKAV